MSLKHYKPATEMIEVSEAISTVDSFENQYVKRYDYEIHLTRAFNEGRRIGAEEKHLDYQAAKESRLYTERKAINSAIEHLRLSIKKLENCKAEL